MPRVYLVLDPALLIKRRLEPHPLPSTSTVEAFDAFSEVTQRKPINGYNLQLELAAVAAVKEVTSCPPSNRKQ